MAKTKSLNSNAPSANEGTFRELNTGNLKFYKPNEMTKGQTFIGTYIETRTMGQYDTDAHIFERTLEDGSNERYAINSTGQLAHYMEQIAPGSLVRLTYDGKSTMAKGKFKGKEAHNFKVAVSNTAPKLAVVAPPVDADDEGDESGESFEDSPL